ncbi:MAG: WYL domain-containing protein [Clostridia bacterium]|nr:WYL domain-containing protein [Clostridia bacterium]
MKEYYVNFYQYGDRVRINLTDLAEKVIFQSDLIIFEASADDHWTRNQFINMLIQNYEGEFELNLDLLNGRDGNYHLLRLNKNSLNLINSSTHPYKRNIRYTGGPWNKKFECPQFIKCLLETYARLPFIEREKLVLKNNVIKPITEAISAGRKLSVTYAYDIKIFYTVSPICIAPAKEGTFQYLVCTEDNGGLLSLRLSRIKEVNAERKKSNALSEFRIKEISEKLAEFGPTFVNEEEVTVKVRLSPAGISHYVYSVMHRPMHIDVEHESNGRDAEDVFVFRCSERQAQYFFFRFAGEAEILEPQSLREKFRNLYQSGLNNYL